MKKTVLLLVAITTTSQAQIAKKVIQTFPAHIVYRINEVESKTKLTEDQQMKIGNSLSKNDKLANVSMSKGDPISRLEKYYAVDKTLLAPILSDNQLDQFLYQRNKHNKFLIALKETAALKLSPSQIKTIRDQNNVFNQEEPIEKQAKVFTKKLDSILTKPQHEKLIEILNIEKSEEQAKEDYNNLLASKLITKKDGADLYKKLYDYHLKRNSSYDLLPETMSADEKNGTWQKLVTEHEPTILTKYKIATKGFYIKNLFTEAILYEKDLKLSENQIDSLLTYQRKLNLATIEYYSKNVKLHSKKANLEKQMKAYKNRINKILTKPQYEKLIKIVNTEKSEKQAKEDYNNLLDSKLITQKDSAGVCTKLYDYYLKINTSYDLLPEKMGDDEKKEVWEKLVTEHEPTILTKYKIATKGFYIKNLFSEAILYEKDLKLTENQIDSLLVYQRKLGLATVEYYSKNENSHSNKANLEKQMKAYKNRISEILTKPQHEKLIENLNSEKSEKQAKEDYKNLLASKLLTQKDSVEVYTKLYNYYLKRNSNYDLLPETMSAGEKNSMWEKLVIEHEPDILTRYKIATNAHYMRNLFTEAIRYEKELKLSETQINSLLAYHRKLILTTIEYYSKNKDSDSNFFADFENTNISKVLDQTQITSLLEKKNETKAAQIAQKNWEDLEKLGMSKDHEKAILKEFTSYHLKSLVASDWVKIDTNMMNVFYKRDLEMQKPELLRQLEAKEQNEKNIKSTKNELRW